MDAGASSSPSSIARVSVHAITEDEFVQQYAAPSRPVILLDIVPGWACFEEWRLPGDLPDFLRMAEVFGDAKVPVVDCDLGTCEDWSGRDYFTWAAGASQQSSKRRLYLKDWHFARACRGLGLQVPYVAPDFLASPLHDWLNHYFDTDGGAPDDYRFCYAGVAGTNTPLHHDVLCSHSWSANISGRKRWSMFPPDTSHLLLDVRGEAAFRAAPEHRPEGWQRRFPGLADAWERRVEVVQEPGELLFVPAGWYHEVENVTDAVSINHNWLNASNAAQVWGFLQSELQAVRRTIGHLRETFDSAEEFEAKCQQLLRANAALGYAGWLRLLAAAAGTLASADGGCAVRSSGGAVPWAAARWREACEAALAGLGEVLGDAEVRDAAAQLRAALDSSR